MCRFTRSTTSRSRMKRCGWQPPPGPAICVAVMGATRVVAGGVVSAVVWSREMAE